MKLLQSELEIQASSNRVWEVLCDFDAYSRWNPFIPYCEGQLQVGAKLRLRMCSPGESGRSLHPTVLSAEPGRDLRWLQRLRLPGLFYHEHYFEIEPLGLKRSRFIQGIQFRGLFERFMVGELSSTILGIQLMNHALKYEAELKPEPAR